MRYLKKVTIYISLLILVSGCGDGKEDEIISQFDPERKDRHHLPPNLWDQFNRGFYPLPRTDNK
mgnify:CR=1 FL=1